MLLDRKQLDVCEAQIANVGYEALGKLAVGQKPIVFAALPGAEVHFVDRDRAVETVAALPTFLQPLGIPPGVRAYAVHDGCRAGAQLGVGRRASPLSTRSDFRVADTSTGSLGTAVTSAS